MCDTDNFVSLPETNTPLQGPETNTQLSMSEYNTLYKGLVITRCC
jgi:hypothetical protein